MARDRERFAEAGKRSDGVVDRTAAQQRAVAVRVKRQPAADALLHEAVEVDARDAQPADRVAGLEPAPVAHGEPADQLLVRDPPWLRVDVGVDVLDERRRLGAVRGVEPRLLHLGVGRGPERVGQHEASGDQQQVAEKAQPAGPHAASRQLPRGRIGVRRRGHLIAMGLVH